MEKVRSKIQLQVQEKFDDHTFSVQELLDCVAENKTGTITLKSLGSVASRKKRKLSDEEESHPSGSRMLTTIKNEPNHSNDDEESIISSSPLSAQIESENEVFQKNAALSRKRNRRSDKSFWMRISNESLRMKGEEYVGYRAVMSPSTGSKTNEFGAIRPAKQLGERCRSSYCLKRKSLRCEDFLEEDRKEIFNTFWKKMDWGQKEQTVISLVDTVPVKRRISQSKQNRKDTFIYYLKLNEQKVQVCRRMFLSTLGMKKDNVLKWLKRGCSNNKNEASPPKEKQKHKEISKYAQMFLDEIPKLPSHYCRANSTKLYLEPDINSQSELYQLYKKYCLDHNYPVCSRFLLSRLIKENNIGIFSPRKDQCDTCVSFKNQSGKVNEEEWTKHRRNKDLARDEKTKDKVDSHDGQCHVLTMDLQAVKVSPMLKASSLYYKTKLIVHNFTVYNLKTKEGVCYWWDETEGDLSSSVFASCLRDYIFNNLKDSLPVIIYSDGCTAQNRNTQMANCLLEIAISQNRIITQKFLEKGHTQMECDSMHSTIESELKNKPIYVPADYIKISTNARQNNPYKVYHLDHTFFKDFTMKKSQRYMSIRPGERKGDPCVTDLRLINYHPRGCIQYKLHYDDADWKELPQRPKPVLCPVTPQLFQNRLKVSLRKYKDLQEIKTVIPKEFHCFYDNLPHEVK